MERSQQKTLAQRIEYFNWLYDEGNGILSTIDEFREFKGRGMSKSSLDYVHRSMDHYFGPPIKQTPAMEVGSAFHTYVLEPEKFDKEYALIEQFDRRTNDGKEGYAKAIKAVGKRTALKPVDYYMIKGMGKAVKNHPRANELLSTGFAEETLIWNDKNTGILMKGRTDWRNEKERCIIDLKSCKEADYASVKKDIFADKTRYYVQAAIYVDAINTITNSNDWKFKFIFVEKSNPYGVCVYEADEQTIECGRRAYAKDLKKLIDWYENAYNAHMNHGSDFYYSGYTEEDVVISPPAWLLYELGIKGPNAN